MSSYTDKPQPAPAGLVAELRDWMLIESRMTPGLHARLSRIIDRYDGPEAEPDRGHAAAEHQPRTDDGWQWWRQAGCVPEVARRYFGSWRSDGNQRGQTTPHMLRTGTFGPQVPAWAGVAPLDPHRSCASHCCKRHGCKYGEPGCPVVAGTVEQMYPCEACDEEPTCAPADGVCEAPGGEVTA